MKENEPENNAIEDKENKAKELFSIKVKKYFKNLFDFSQYDKKTIAYIIVFIIIIILSIALILYMIFVDDTILYRFVINFIVNPLFDLGFWGIVIFLGFMALQGVITPLPSEALLLSTGMIYGLIGGGIIGSLGSITAGALCCYLSRKGGRPLAKKFVGEKALDSLDKLIDKYGMGVIIVARMIPFIPFDPISFASGLVKLDFKKYILATAIGSIPRAFFWAWLGTTLGVTPPVNISNLNPDQFATQVAFFNMILIVIALVFIIGFGAFYVYSLYLEKKTNL